MSRTLVLAAQTLATTGDLATRVEASAEAGFTAIGLRPADYLGARRAGASDAVLRRILEAAGVAVTELSVLHGFAALCDRTAAHGLRVALEFLPWTSVPDAATAWEVVRRAERPNDGVLVDSWHHFRGACNETQLLAIPPERVVAIQIDDADPRLERTTAMFNDGARHGEDPAFGRGSNAAVRAWRGDTTHRPNPCVGTVEEPPYHGTGSSKAGRPLSTHHEPASSAKWRA